MDETAYFQNPKITQFALLIGVDTIACPPDPQRVAIIFSYQIPPGGILYLNPGNAIKSASPSGIIIPVGVAPFIVRHDQLPGLPQQLWHVMSPNGNMPFNVVEVTLRQWSK